MFVGLRTIHFLNCSQIFVCKNILSLQPDYYLISLKTKRTKRQKYLLFLLMLYMAMSAMAQKQLFTGIVKESRATQLLVRL